MLVETAEVIAKILIITEVGVSEAFPIIPAINEEAGTIKEEAALSVHVLPNDGKGNMKMVVMLVSNSSSSRSSSSSGPLKLLRPPFRMNVGKNPRRQGSGLPTTAGRNLNVTALPRTAVTETNVGRAAAVT